MAVPEGPHPREKLFEFGRCVAHFAVDESDVRFCTHLKGKASWFLPFNRGWNDGAGNPPNPSGIKTNYLWRDVLTRESLTDILENYAQVVEATDEKTGKKKRTQIWSRYQQIDVVRRLLADAATRGAGRRYLIQQSAGSGQSNSIAWLAHQLIGLTKDDASIFDSIIVVTDRRILDRQIRDTIRQYAQVGATVGHADRSGDLRRFIESGKKIIISTVQKFPFILDEIGNEQRGRSFAIIIDEAHSSQCGHTSAAMTQAIQEGFILDMLAHLRAVSDSVKHPLTKSARSRVPNPRSRASSRCRPPPPNHSVLCQQSTVPCGRGQATRLR